MNTFVAEVRRSVFTPKAKEALEGLGLKITDTYSGIFQGNDYFLVEAGDGVDAKIMATGLFARVERMPLNFISKVKDNVSVDKARSIVEGMNFKILDSFSNFLLIEAVREDQTEQLMGTGLFTYVEREKIYRQA